jgi:hypothetical protein
MSILPVSGLKARLGKYPRVAAVAAALGLSVGAFFAGLLGMFPSMLLASVLGVTEMDAYRVVAGNRIQVGFAVFAALYLFTVDDRDRFVKIRVPTISDLAWIGLTLAFIVGVLPPVFDVLSTVGEHLFGVESFTHGSHESDSEAIELAARPSLWPVVFVGSYLFAAPAEELVYRGIVQGRLRDAFGTAGVVLFGALSFGMMHLLVGLVTPGTGLVGTLYWASESAAGGLVWGYVYERTENLVVTASTHAMLWTVPFHELPFV